MPFGDALLRIEKAGFDFGRDRWEAWVRRRLMSKAERIPGTNNYGLRTEQWEKLKRFVVIDNQLFGRRSPDAVTYYAALWGIEVPANLVAAYMVKGIHTYYRTLRRRLIQQSSGRLDPRMLDESDVYKLAKKGAKDILAITPRVRNPIKRLAVQQFAEAAAFIMFSMAYDVKPERSLAGTIRGLANGLFTAPTAAVGARFLRQIIESEGSRFVDPDIGDNRILDEVRVTARDHPEILLRACRDSGLAFAASVKGFGLEERHRRGRPPNDATGVARENARAYYALLPIVSAIFLTMNLDDPDNRFLATLRKDEGKSVAEQIRRLDRISEWQRRRLETRP